MARRQPLVQMPVQPDITPIHWLTEFEPNPLQAPETARVL